MTNDGGPAFPFAAEYGHPAACGGMSLRDWFAGMAMQGTLANEGWSSGLVSFSYGVADDMLAEREKARGGAA